MNGHDHQGLQLLRELLAIPSPPGREQAMGAHVAHLITAMGYQPETDPAGNVLVRLDGSDPDAGLAVLAAHLDEIAVLVTLVEPDGTLRVAASGAILPMKIGERPVTVLGDRGQTTGILSFGSTHGDGVDRIGSQWDKMRIATGLSPRQLAEIGIRPGSTAVPLAEHRGPHLFGDPEDPFVAAWTLDDRLGVVTLLRLLEQIKRQGIKPNRPTVIAFTVHEEGGCHGAKVLAHRERPEVFIAIDGCAILPDNGLANDGRPTTWSHDYYGHMDQRLILAFQDACRNAGTNLQVNVFASGASSDASAVYNAGAAPRVGIIGHARENSHGFEFTRLSSFDHLLNTLAKLIIQPW